VQYASLAGDIGFRKAKEYLCTGEWLIADEAQRLGLVDWVVPRERLEAETMQLAQRIAPHDPFALRIAKGSLKQRQDKMGFRTSVTTAFHNYALTHVYRLAQGEEPMSGADRARRREEIFGDNH
jgi:enoyl-CoA hydratase